MCRCSIDLFFSCHTSRLGACGLVSDGCYCDSDCAKNGDCCSDYQLQCASPHTPQGSCAKTCVGRAKNGTSGCYCDASCLALGDCCQDRAQFCSVSLTCPRDCECNFWVTLCERFSLGYAKRKLLPRQVREAANGNDRHLLVRRHVRAARRLLFRPGCLVFKAYGERAQRILRRLLWAQVHRVLL